MSTSSEYILRQQRGITLGVGPVSLNCTNAAIDAAREAGQTLLMVVSRRQVDSAELGGGYVNSWTTEAFAPYVRARSGDVAVLLERDHGGPWQSEVECARRDDPAAAMASAKRSYECDILSGFDILHLDPGVASAQGGAVGPEEFAERTKDLYAHCAAFARRHERQVSFEIGTDEGTIGSASGPVIEHFIDEMVRFCTSEKLPLPIFAVLQTGTKVMETQNVGPLNGWIEQTGRLPPDHSLPSLAAACHRHGIATKEHNLDYAPLKTLQWHDKALIDAANVAPEFGVVETRSLLRTLSDLGRKDLGDRFVELALSSGKWKKWMLPGSKATDLDRAVIAGHYVFSTPAFAEIKADASRDCASRGLDLDHTLQGAIKARIGHYLSTLSTA